MTSVKTRVTGYAALLACAVVIGALLRLYILPSQILLDDEWHGLNQVIDASLSDVLTTFDAKDNTSLPLNLYHWTLLHTVGWSELTIRLPVIMAGLLGLILMPLAVRKTLGDRVSLVFAFLLAVAPFAIFYSRFSRAYVVVMLFGFLSLLYAHRWLSTGERRSATGFLAAGTIASYTHPLAAIVVVVPFALYYLKAFGRGSAGEKIPSAGGMVLSTVAQTASTGAGINLPEREVRRYGLIQAVVLLPLAWLIFSASAKLPWGGGAWSFSGLRDTATLLSGTTSLPLNLAWYGLLGWGIVSLFRRNPLLARMYAATGALYLGVLMVSRPLGLDTGVVALRYAIVVVPIALSVVAAGIDALWTRYAGGGGSAADEPGHRRPAAAVAAAPLVFLMFLVSFFIAGPLPAIYTRPNNFTNHSAYQGSYDPPDDARSDSRHVYPGFSVARNDVPEFYRRLWEMRDVATIVEYPLDVTNYNNLFWFYQRVHAKEVLAGYCPERSFLGHRTELPPGSQDQPLRLGLLGADQILSHAADRSKLRFRNLVDVTDPGAVSRSGADFVVLHKSVMALRFLPGGNTDAVPVRYASVPVLAAEFTRFFGPPAWEDESIVCFRLRKP